MGLFGFGKKKKAEKKSTSKAPYQRMTYMEAQVDATKICKNSILQFAEIKDGDRIVPLKEAIERCYADPKLFLPWSFHVQNVQLEKSEKGFDVFGDGVKLGEIHRNSFEGSDYYYISQLFEMDKIDRLEAVIKTSSNYFALNKEQYKAMVKSDPHGRGTPPWMENNPKVKLKVFFDPKIFGLDIGMNYIEV